MENLKPEDIKFINALIKIQKEEFSRDYSFNQMAELFKFTNLLMDISKGKFVCSKCGKEFQIYAVGK